MASDPYAELRYIPRPFKRRSAAPVIERSASPCADCVKSDRCAGQQLACAALEIFENQRRFSAAAPRQPSREIYQRLYGEDE
jgi:hypothetical protein